MVNMLFDRNHDHEKVTLHVKKNCQIGKLYLCNKNANVCPLFKPLFRDDKYCQLIFLDFHSMIYTDV